MITARADTIWDTEGCTYGYTTTSCQASKQTKRVEKYEFHVKFITKMLISSTKLWTDEVFQDVLADRHRTRYELKNRVTYDCLKQILSWSHSKMLAIKWFTAKQSVVLNDDGPRPVPIPKDFTHLMIRKIDEAYI